LWFPFGNETLNHFSDKKYSMFTRRITTKNKTALYIIAVVIIVVAILLLAGGGGHSMGGFMHGSRSMGLANWNWIQILVSLGIGFILGLLVAKRRL
jgi:TRAP-type C4-dicarboxylate transport system permease small subunit